MRSAFLALACAAAGAGAPRLWAAGVTVEQRAAARAQLEAAPLPAPSGAEEVRATLRDAYADFLAGRYDSAASGYKYIVTLGSPDAWPEADLALMLRDSGHPDDAAAHWLKATLLAPADAFLWDQRAWNYLALGRTREAEDAFRKAVSVAQRSDDRGEAQLGLGLALAADGDENAALAPLRDAAAADPYAAAAADAEVARLLTRLRKPAQAIPYDVASLDADPRQLDVAQDLARLYRKTGEGLAEWQAWKLTLGMDPRDAEAAKDMATLERWLPGRPEDSLPVLRLGRPVFRLDDASADAPPDASPRIRVGLFSGPDGRLRHATHFFVMGSTVTRLHDVKLDEDVVAPADAYQQWEVSYRPDTRVIEIRDMEGRIVYVTKQPFELIPNDPRYTVLLKNVELTDISGMDIGDRELRGLVEVIPTPDGFHLVNELPLDQYLYSIVGADLPAAAPLEAYKTMAVIDRTRMLDAMAQAAPNPERTQTCDSSACVRYVGLSGERADSARAVRATRGITVRLAGGDLPETHLDSGWMTASGVQDRQTPTLGPQQPLDLELLAHRGPDDALYSQASALIPVAWTRWVRVLDAGAVRARAERVKDLGPLKAVTVLGRDASGRATGLRLTGRRGTLDLAGLAQMEAVLSPGSLRSAIFTVTPLYDGHTVSRLVLWGAGTGDGRGVAIAGAVGQAHLGRRFDQILRHYYGDRLAFIGYTPPPPPAVPAPVRRRRRPVASPHATPARHRRPRHRRPAPGGP